MRWVLGARTGAASGCQLLRAQVGQEEGRRAGPLSAVVGSGPEPGLGHFQAGPQLEPLPSPPASCSQAQPRAGSWGFPGEAPGDSDSQLKAGAHRTHFSQPTAPRKSSRRRVGPDPSTLQP